MYRNHLFITFDIETLDTHLEPYRRQQGQGWYFFVDSLCSQIGMNHTRSLVIPCQASGRMPPPSWMEDSTYINTVNLYTTTQTAISYRGPSFQVPDVWFGERKKNPQGSRNPVDFSFSLQSLHQVVPAYIELLHLSKSLEMRLHKLEKPTWKSTSISQATA